MVGYGPQIDEFVVGMNRAAEKAVPFAKDIFWDAIGAMTSTTPAKFSTATTPRPLIISNPRLPRSFKRPSCRP